MTADSRGASWRGLVFVLSLTTVGCEIFAPTACTLEARAALSVEVLDSVTLEPVRGDVRVIARTDAIADTLDTTAFPVPPSLDRDTMVFGPFGLAHERPGTYDVIVEALDYTPWQRLRVRVGEDECHVQTVELTARLRSSES